MPVCRCRSAIDNSCPIESEISPIKGLASPKPPGPNSRYFRYAHVITDAGPPVTNLPTFLRRKLQREMPTIEQRVLGFSQKYDLDGSARRELLQYKPSPTRYCLSRSIRLKQMCTMGVKQSFWYAVFYKRCKVSFMDGNWLQWEKVKCQQSTIQLHYL